MSLKIKIISIKLHPIYRIGQYYYYIGVLNILPLLKNFIKSKDLVNKKIINFLIYSALIFMFVWLTLLGNGHKVYPYQSDIYTWMK